MKNKFLLLFIMNTLLLVSFVNANFYYDIKMNSSDEGIKINSVEIIFSHYDLTNTKEDYANYSLKINDRDFYFNLPERYYDVVDNETGNIIGGGKLVEKEAEFELIVPYSGSGKTIEIYDNLGNKILEKSLIEYTRLYTKNEYSKLNPVNEINEENDNNLIDNGNVDNFEVQKSWDYPIIIIILLIILLIGLIIYYLNGPVVKKKKEGIVIARISRNLAR